MKQMGVVLVGVWVLLAGQVSAQGVFENQPGGCPGGFPCKKVKGKVTHLTDEAIVIQDSSGTQVSLSITKSRGQSPHVGDWIEADVGQDGQIHSFQMLKSDGSHEGRESKESTGY